MAAHLCADDVRQLLRLVHECREIGAAGERPALHFLHGIARITRSQVAIVMAANGVVPGVPPEIREVLDVGWPSASDRDRVYEYVGSHAVDSDPLAASVVRSPGSVVTLARCHAISPAAWARTDCCNVDRRSGVDDAMISLARRGGTGDARVIVLKRARGEQPYGETERDLLDLAHGECGWLLDGPWRGATGSLGGQWSPREREILDRLLTGASEKTVAATLGLSPHTVHDYVKAIYRRMGVASRAELMARALTVRMARLSKT